MGSRKRKSNRETGGDQKGKQDRMRSQSYLRAKYRLFKAIIETLAFPLKEIEATEGFCTEGSCDLTYIITVSLG